MPPQPVIVDTSAQHTTYGGRDILISSDDPKVEITARLRAPVTPPLPRPKIDTVDRPGTVGLTRWMGRDPYEIVLPIQFDRFTSGDSVEPQIRALEQLALRRAGAATPPVIQIEGPVPNPTNVGAPRWRISGFTEVPERTLFNPAGDRCRFAVDVTLIEHVVDRVLTESIAGGGGRGIANRHTRVKAGETSLYDVARRVYGGDGSRAADIARANSLRLSRRLKVGDRLRLP